MKILLALIFIYLISAVSVNAQSIPVPPGEPGAPKQTASGAPYP